MIKVEYPAETLPVWMRRAQRGFDWGALLALVIGLIAAWPFILQPGLPRTNASEAYVYRTADTAEAILEGRLYPRWSPHAFGGYGAPVAHFAPPAPAYVPALVQILLTDDAVTAVRLVYIGALCLASGAVYALVTRQTGSATGVLASLLYVFSPYAGMTAPHILGDLPGVMSLSLVPALLWSIDGLLRLNRPADVAVVALTTALLLLTDLRFAAGGLMLGGLFAFWLVVKERGDCPWTALVAGVALGLEIAAFYWLPALAERNEALWVMLAPPTPLELRLPDLLLPPEAIDLIALLPGPQLSIGVGTALAVLVSLPLFRRLRWQIEFQAFFLACGVGLLLLVPLLFPLESWLLGLIALCLALGGSAVLFWRAALPHTLHRSALSLAALVILIAAAPVWLAPRWPTSFGDTSPQAQVQHEQQGYGVAVMPPGMPVPTTLVSSLQPSRLLLNGYRTGRITKIDVSALTANAQIGLLSHTAHEDRFQAQFFGAVDVQILTAYFAGWTASLDGFPMPVERNPSTGLINILISGGLSGELVVALNGTPARTAGWALTWSALALTALVTVRRVRRAARLPDDYHALQLLAVPEARLLTALLAAFAAVVLLTAAPDARAPLRPDPGSGLTALTPLRVRTDVGLEAIGWEIEATRLRAGSGAVRFSLYWRALRLLPENYRVRPLLIERLSGQAYPGESENIPVQTLPHLGGYPTQRWFTERYVRDRHRIPLPADLPSGEYQIGLELYRCTLECAPFNRLMFFNADGEPLGARLVLPGILVVAPS